MNRIEYPAGEAQKIVVYVTRTSASPSARGGWRIVSTAVLPLRQMGTAGNILYQSGGQFATRAGVAVFYGKA